MKLRIDRLNKALGIFATAGRTRDGRPTSYDLRLITGLGAGALSANYRSSRRLASFERLAAGIAALWGLEPPDRVALWLLGAEDLDLDIFVAEQSVLVQCGDCLDLFTEAEMIMSHRKCRRCVREAITPAASDWQQDVESRITDVSDGLIVTAWKHVTGDPSRAITDLRLAAAAGLTLTEFKKRWNAAKLPRKRNYAPATRPTSAFMGPLFPTFVIRPDILFSHWDRRAALCARRSPSNLALEVARAAEQVAA